MTVILQIAGRDILSTIDREMSGDLKQGFTAVGKYSIQFPFNLG